MKKHLWGVYFSGGGFGRSQARAGVRGVRFQRMSIEESGVIDIISSEKDGSAVTLTATDHLEWGDREHLMKVQDKLNSYLAFVESGEIVGAYPNAKGKEIRLELVCKYVPDEEGEKFLSLCQQIIGEAGYCFSYRVA